MGYEKSHKQQRWPQAWEYCQAKPIQTLGRASQGVNWSWIKSHTLRHLQEKSDQATSEPETSSEASYLKNWTVAQCSKVLFSDERTCCISFVNQGPRVWRKRGETQNPCWLKSSVKSPQSVMIWAAVTSAGVGLLCFLKSTVNADNYQEILEHFMLPSADKLYGDADFIFQQDLAPAHTAKGTGSWFNDHVLLCLTGQQTHQTWTPENLDERHQTQQYRWPEPQRI